MISWSDIAAIWGCVLSTVTAVPFFSSQRPILILESPKNSTGKTESNTQTLNLRIMNFSNRSALRIVKYSTYGAGDIRILPYVDKDSDSLEEKLNKLVKAANESEKTRQLNLYVPTQSEITVVITNITRDTNYHIFFTWRNGLLPTIPKYLFVSWGVACQIYMGNRNA
jgi:hypothetical protein